jgi:succinyl-diaminopimelate desuccinylase
LDDPAAAKKLACDIVVVSDSSQFARGKPAITYGLRGLAYFEVVLQGPRQDLHSGVFGGAVTNPALALCRMMAALIDDRGRVTIPGFYDGVDPLPDDERDQLASLQYSEDDLKRQLDVDALSGEEGFSALERRWVRPTYDINGLTSGYQGEGAKTVLPARASAKFSFRLVPHQDPARIAASLREMLTRLCPPGIRMELREMSHAPGIVIPRESPFVAAARRAIAKGFGREPVMIREGGSIPIVGHFAERLGVDTLLLGWGLDDDNTHSPNEKFSLEDYHRGIRSSAWLWDEISRIGNIA